ncbi:MAG: hypothetical protein ACOCWW_01005 [Bacteroidota bacterium]
MTFSFKTPELKFSDRLLNFLELLGLESRKNMAGKSAVGILLLKNEKKEKEAILKQEIRSRIDEINNLLDGALLFLFISLTENNKGPIDSYAEIFKDYLRDGLKLIYEEDKKYNKSVKKVESMLYSSEKKSALKYADIYASKDEILNLPKIKQLVNVLAKLHHIDLLHINLEAVKNDSPTYFGSSKDSVTKKIIKEEFEAMDSNKGWNYAFKNIEDYENYCVLLTHYFEAKNPHPPKEIIKLKPRTETAVARALRTIFHELGDGVLKNKTDYLNLIKVLSPFHGMTNIEVYNKLTK